MQQEITPNASLRPGADTTTPSDLHLINMTATTLAEVALRLQTVKYTKMVGLAVLVFDYCIMLGDEIYLTWGRKWGIVRILFVVARYMPFAYVSMDLLYSFGHNSPRHCLFIYQVSSCEYSLHGCVSTRSAPCIFHSETDSKGLK
ncbi:hypothetical protein M405DRAFT_412981 [Rhizopogon salebrosus TDB-379]|nr:hypothetical protein M405DRAFT_412981 [Rhizopogon salebrosus TDB-379]